MKASQRRKDNEIDEDVAIRFGVRCNRFAGWADLQKIPPGRGAAERLDFNMLSVTGSLIGGLLTLTILSYGRRHVHEIGYDSDGLTLPAYWLSLVIAPLGAVLVLALNRLIRARKLRT